MDRRWLFPQANPNVVAFTVTPTASAKTVTLENFSAPYNFFIDWGDGQKSAQITGNSAVSHTYAGTTPRKIVIRGILGGFWNTTAISEGKALVTSVDEVNSRSLVTLAHTFRGCTALATVPAMVDAPNVADFSYAFYQCRSITSALPALWLSHPSAAHTGCFTSCFKSLYGQYGTGCSFRQYVAAVAGQTYYQKYGTGCPAATYHAGTPQQTFYQKYRTTCPNRITYDYTCWSIGHVETCPFDGKKRNTVYSCTKGCGAATTWPTVWHANYSPSHPCGGCGSTESSGTIWYSITMPVKTVLCYSDCTIIYSQGSAAYSSCGQSTASGTSTCKSTCKRTYTSGQSAYYKCTKSNATCPTTNCPYPYANEADVNAAKAAGWA